MIPLMSQLTAATEWLTRPSPKLPAAERQRSHLLAWVLLCILAFLLFTLGFISIFNPRQDPRRFAYIGLILAMTALVLAAYMANRAGRYTLAAGLIVASAVAAPWVSLAFDPSILQGDFVPLTYITLSIMLSSILLSPAVTIALAVVQWSGLALVLFSSPFTPQFNWFSFLCFVFFTAMFSILTNSIIQRNMQQINRQALLLQEREAQLQEQSLRDPLTSLYNRRYLSETLEREVLRVARKGAPLGVIMLDIDHFKTINDTLGHTAGDRALQAAGRLLSGQVRGADIVCRYGGDEFVMILPEASVEATRQRAEQLRAAAQDLLHTPDSLLSHDLSFSLGVAAYPENGASGEAILNAADAALYQAKRGGRNRVVVFGSVKSVTDASRSP